MFSTRRLKILSVWRRFSSELCPFIANFFIGFFFNAVVKRLSTAKVLKTATDCAQLLHTWRQSYLDTRAFIENSGVGSRWEFDKVLLFNDSDHIAKISQDIANVAKVT
jgi:Dynein heavy chain, N-terminal region 1